MINQENRSQVTTHYEVILWADGVQPPTTGVLSRNRHDIERRICYSWSEAELEYARAMDTGANVAVHTITRTEGLCRR